MRFSAQIMASKPPSLDSTIPQEHAMTLRSLLSRLAATLLVTLAAPAIHATDAPPNMPQGKEWCQKNPEKCADMKAQRKAWCEKHPEECQRMEQKREDRRKWCQANPEECAKQREERKKKRAEMRERCKADPAKCEEKKQDLREKLQDRKAEKPVN